MIYYTENYTPPAAACNALTAKNIENLYKAPFFRSACNRLFPAAGKLHKNRRGKDRGTGTQTRGKPKKGRRNLSRCPFVCGNTRLYPAFTASSVDFPRLTARTYPRSARHRPYAAPRNSAPSTSDAGSVSACAKNSFSGPKKPRATASLHFERAKFWKSPHSVLY